MGRKWTDEEKQRQRILVKERMNSPEIRWKIGSANRGKKFSTERIKQMHGHRNSDSYSHQHSSEIKSIIGIKSKAKFTEDYKKRDRTRRESSGQWIPISQKSDWEIYTKTANWIERMFDIIADDKNLLQSLGVFNCATNRKGVVRDHVYSRKSGFLVGVFPELLRHPSNCQIITHSDNVAKKSKRYVDANGKSLEQLFEDIQNYNGKWREQNLCLESIKKYLSGERWKRKEASNEN